MLRQNTKWTLEQEEDLIKNYKKVPLKRLSSKYGCTEAAVIQRAYRLGISNKTGRLTQEQKDEILELRKKGLTYAVIADMVDTTPGSTFRLCKKGDVK
ncbi:MAG: hypothetical protein ACRCZ2_00575 [Fusobacteriaceae bacterium]